MSSGLDAVVARLNQQTNPSKKQKKEPAPPANQQPKPTGVAVPVKAEPKQDLRASLKGSANGFTARPANAKPTATVAPRPGTAAAVIAARKAQQQPQSQPLAKRIKDVVEFLRAEQDKSFTKEQLQEKTQYDLATDVELRMSLAENERVQTLADGQLKYRSRHPHITDATKLLNHIRDKRFGVQLDELLDSYKNVAKDIDKMVADKKVIKVLFPDSQTQDVEVLFPRDTLGVRVDAEVVELYHSIQLPEDVVGLQDAVTKERLRSTLANQPQKRQVNTAAGKPKEKKKKKINRKFNVAKATNVHLPELFMGAQPENIDDR